LSDEGRRSAVDVTIVTFTLLKIPAVVITYDDLSIMLPYHDGQRLIVPQGLQ